MIWTVPNMLTIARVIAAPCVALAFIVLERPNAHWVAFGLFSGAAVTDWIDGWYARRYDAGSAFGKMLDPIADKAMVIIALFTLAALLGEFWWFILPATVILLREVLVSGLREYLGDIKLDVTKLAKWKTTAQMLAIGGLFLTLGARTWIAEVDVPQVGELAARKMKIARLGGGPLFYASLTMLWLAAALTLVTGWDYFQKGLRHIRDDAPPRREAT